MELEGHVAVVTGGAMGIGKAAAQCLAREGAAVMIVDKQQEAARQAAAELDGHCGPVASITGDIGRAEDCRLAVEETVKKFARLDILVNNAGIQTFGGPVDTTEEIWDRTMNANLKGHWLMSKCAIPHMLQRGKGAIVNVSSVQGLASQANVVAYATASTP